MITHSTLCLIEPAIVMRTRIQWVQQRVKGELYQTSGPLSEVCNCDVSKAEGFLYITKGTEQRWEAHKCYMNHA